MGGDGTQSRRNRPLPMIGLRAKFGSCKHTKEVTKLPSQGTHPHGWGAQNVINLSRKCHPVLFTTFGSYLACTHTTQTHTQQTMREAATICHHPLQVDL